MAEWFDADACEYERLSRWQLDAKEVETQFRFRVTTEDLFPCLDDRNVTAAVDPHYFYGDLWAAKLIAWRQPRLHVDVGSRLDGLVSHVLACGVAIEHVDVRPVRLQVAGLTLRRSDATEMTGYASASVASLSSIHAMEHFGLGRYGDAVDPWAWHRAVRAFARVLAPGGALYVAVPIGVERLCFNAHRIFAPRTVVDAFVCAGVDLVSFAAVTDGGTFLANAKQDGFENAQYACGLFEFWKHT